MSLASIVGAILAYPINHWLVKNKLKHGMGTVRALGKGGTSVAGEHPQASRMPKAGQSVSPATPMAEIAGMEGEPEPLRNRGTLTPLHAHTAGQHGPMKMAEVPTGKKNPGGRQ